MSRGDTPDATTASASFTYAAAGSYDVSLTVHDGEGLSGFGGPEPDLSDLEGIGDGRSSMGFVDELAELDVPDDMESGDE